MSSANITLKRQANAKGLLLLCSVMLAAWALLTINIGGPWVGHQDGNGAWISVAARNWQRYGFGATNGIVLLNPERTTPDHYEMYLHHPPLAVWWMSALSLVAGYDETLIRFAAAAGTLMTVAVLYRLARDLYGSRTAFWSAVLFAATPMIAYFGRMPDHEAPAILFLTGFAVVMLAWLHRPTLIRWLVLSALTVAIVWTAWGALIGFGLLWLIMLWHSARKDGQQRLRRVIPVLALGAVAAAAFGSLLVYYLAAEPTTLERLANAFLWRSSDQSALIGSEAFTMTDYLLRQGGRWITLLTFNTFILALIGLTLIFREKGVRRSLPLALLGGGVIYVLLLRNASYIHDYYLLYTTPALALMAAHAVTYSGWRRNTRRWMRPLIAALLILLPISLFVYLGALYQGSDDAEPPQIAEGLKSHTTPRSLIMSDLQIDSLAIEFYAERDITWGTSPEAVDTQVIADYFLTCVDPAALPLTPTTAPAKISDNCWLVTLSEPIS